MAELGINEPPTDNSPKTVTAVAELSTSMGLYPSPPPFIQRVTMDLKVVALTSCMADVPFPLNPSIQKKIKCIQNVITCVSKPADG